MKKVKIYLILLLLLMPVVAKAEEETITIKNCGRYNRNPSTSYGSQYQYVWYYDGGIFTSGYGSAYPDNNFTPETDITSASDCPSLIKVCSMGTYYKTVINSDSCPTFYGVSSKWEPAESSQPLVLTYCGRFTHPWGVGVTRSGNMYIDKDTNDLYMVITNDTSIVVSHDYVSSFSKVVNTSSETLEWCPTSLYQQGGNEGYYSITRPSGEMVNEVSVNIVEKPVVQLEESDKYKGVTSCRDVDYKYIKDCGCMPASLTDLTSRLYMLIKIAAPALLLIIGGFDLVKAMSAQDEKAINKARQKLVRKFIAAAAVFLIFTLIQFIVSTLSNDSATTMKCIDYILNGYVA